MYAAAGGASIASRKARQNKAQGKLPVKKPPVKVKAPVIKHTPVSKQFHHLPDNYHKHADPNPGLAAPNDSLNHSRSLTLRPGDSDSSGLRASRSAHELPDPALEPGVVGASRDGNSSLAIGSPPRAYSCTHWESRLQKTPSERIVGFGSADVPFAVCECAQGKAAWQEAAGAAGFAGGRRCSVAADPAQGGTGYRVKQTEAHLRWMKRNRIHDLSYGGSSSDEEESVRARAAGAAGGLLYVGLGTVALGLVISFVGTGDKGFKTYELRLAGPALIAAGLVCCVLRILLCACPVRCRPPRARARRKEPAAERLLLTERPPPRRLSIAATALLLQHEKESQPTPTSPLVPPGPQPQPVTQQPRPTSPPAPSRSDSAQSPVELKPLSKQPSPVVPLVLLSQPLPQKDDSLIELQTLDGSSFDISSISSSELSVDNLTVIETANLDIAESIERASKLARTREPVFARRASNLGPPRTVTFADTPNIIAPPSEAPPPPTEIVLTPSKLGQ